MSVLRPEKRRDIRTDRSRALPWSRRRGRRWRPSLLVLQIIVAGITPTDCRSVPLRIDNAIEVRIKVAHGQLTDRSLNQSDLLAQAGNIRG
jgi:hypothetical protein